MSPEFMEATMTRRFLRPRRGNITRSLGGDRYEVSVSIPADGTGIFPRECPDVPSCVPGYFRVKDGTGIVGSAYDKCFCPYCGRKATPDHFFTPGQVKYAESVVLREAHGMADELIRRGLGLDSRGRRKISEGFLDVSMELKPSSPPPLTYPREDKVRRDLTCPHCSLEHAVFGLAVWCPDCGEDIFLSHTDAEIEVIKKILADVSGRRERLGRRVAVRDIENALEDLVSLFEGVLKFVTRRSIEKASGKEAADDALKGIRNGFQNPNRAAELVLDLFDIELFAGADEADWKAFAQTLGKRHPITHNLGVADPPYMARSVSRVREGRDVAVSVDEVDAACLIAERVFSQLYQALRNSRTPSRNARE